ncbi:MAG: phage major capsid protein [Eubacteriales bacterium]|jgi:HK97 family phage major capsid protein
MVQELLQKRAALVTKQEEMLKTAHTENRNLTVDEYAIFEKMDADIIECEKMIESNKKVMDRLSSLDDNYKEIDFGKGTSDTRNAQEFGSFGEFLVAVARAGAPYGRFPGAGVVDNRLSKIAIPRDAASGMSANVPADGGFLISPTRSNEILQKTYETGAIASRCAAYEIGDYSDSLEVPYVNESSRANGSRWGGFRAYREGEVDAPTASNTDIGLWECRVTDLKALIYITERLLNDAPAMESLIMDLLPQEFAFKLDDEILNGSGGIQCKGIIGDPATVNITKETGQVADTVLYENILKQWARCWGRSRANAAFYYNQDCEPQLFALSMNVGTGGVPVFLPANGLSGSPYATLFGRPLIPVEQAATVGTEGDIILGDFSQYAIVRKGGLRSASSVHVKFIYDEMTFKFNMRVNGKPKWKSVLTPFKGTNTLAPFVTIDDRD